MITPRGGWMISDTRGMGRDTSNIFLLLDGEGLRRG